MYDGNLYVNKIWNYYGCIISHVYIGVYHWSYTYPLFEHLSKRIKKLAFDFTFAQIQGGHQWVMPPIRVTCMRQSISTAFKVHSKRIRSYLLLRRRSESFVKGTFYENFFFFQLNLIISFFHFLRIFFLNFIHFLFDVRNIYIFILLWIEKIQVKRKEL